MEFKFEYKAYEKGSKDVQKIERKIKWEKVDKDLYSAMVQTDIDQLKHIMLFISVGFPLSFHILYFALIILSADLISGVHIFSFGFALKIKWEKVDKDLYSAMVQTDIDQLNSQLVNNELPLDDVISKTSKVMKNAAILSLSTFSHLIFLSIFWTSLLPFS
jgi:hypothetical protein